jgi:hypothetical protein
MSGINNFRARDNGLIELQLSIWNGFIFIHMANVGANRQPYEMVSGPLPSAVLWKRCNVMLRSHG